MTRRSSITLNPVPTLGEKTKLLRQREIRFPESPVLRGKTCNRKDALGPLEVALTFWGESGEASSAGEAGSEGTRRQGARERG